MVEKPDTRQNLFHDIKTRKCLTTKGFYYDSLLHWLEKMYKKFSEKKTCKTLWTFEAFET